MIVSQDTASTTPCTPKPRVPRSDHGVVVLTDEDGQDDGAAGLADGTLQEATEDVVDSLILSSRSITQGAYAIAIQARLHLSHIY